MLSNRQYSPVLLRYYLNSAKIVFWSVSESPTKYGEILNGNNHAGWKDSSFRII